MAAEETALRELEPDFRMLKQQKKELLEVQEKVRRQETKVSGGEIFASLDHVCKTCVAVLVGAGRTAQAVGAELQEHQMKRSDRLSASTCLPVHLCVLPLCFE